MAKKGPENQPADAPEDGGPATVQVRLPVLLVRHARMVADSKHLKLTAYLTTLLQPIIERELPAAMRKLNLPFPQE